MTEKGMTMGNHSTNDRLDGRPDSSASGPSRPTKQERLQALLFTAASIGTTLLTLGLLAETKLPRQQGE